MNVSDSTASIRPPAIASPNERPNDPAAEFTPAASLMPSSEIGARVKLLSCETRRPRPEPAIASGTTSHHPESTRGTSGRSATIPRSRSAKPARTMTAGR